MIFFILIAILIIGLQLLKDWLTYKHRGHAKPDHSDQGNYPIITSPMDAQAHHTIDRTNMSKKLKSVKKF